MTFIQKLETAIQMNNSLLCIGLDTDPHKLPIFLQKEKDGMYLFNKAIVEKTHHLVSSYKLQIAYYAALGIPGIQILMQTINFIKTINPSLPIILDAKRADIGETAKKYAEEAFDCFMTDAVTVNPYLGKDSLIPFLERKDKGIIILCKTSNEGAAEFQNLLIEGEPLYIRVARQVKLWHEEYGNCLMVVGATWPVELRNIRNIVPHMFFLVPGIGAQGGDLEKTMRAGLRFDKSGLIIHSARGIIYASDSENFAEKAAEETEKLKNLINQYR